MEIVYEKAWAQIDAPAGHEISFRYHYKGEDDIECSSMQKTRFLVWDV